MDEATEKRVETLVEAVRLRQPEERDAYLTRACGDDETLRIEVERRIWSERSALSQLPASDASTEVAAPHSAQGLAGVIAHPLRISSYSVVGLLGEGGVGVVYRARQSHPRRDVALKVLKAGRATAATLRRFEYEAEVLGRLQHPGIAQIFEAGAADTGTGLQPFMAMELIEGVSLLAYADERHLDVRARLDLLVKVCDGIAHAHQKGVIHRDLKPGNILVDRSGQPRILDFGIALAIDREGSSEHGQPGRRHRAGTLPYMSPEQLRGDLDELDTRTDVYALGVIAYQLLAGRLPYDFKGRTIENADQVFDEQPLCPMETIDPALRGDLDCIVGRALDREKNRRYQSAADFAADVRRFLSDQPVLARAPTALYLFRKFVRRNRAVACGALATVVALLAGIIVSSGLYFRARHHAENAQATLSFLLDDVLAAIRPGHAGKDATLKEALDQAATKLKAGSLADRPEVNAAVSKALGMSYRSLDYLEDAEPFLASACDIYERALGPNSRETLKARNEYALLLRLGGRLQEAEAMYRRTLQAERRHLGEYDRDTLETWNNLAVALVKQERLDEAESEYRRLLAIQQALFGPEGATTLMTMGNLAQLLRRSSASGAPSRERLAEAEGLYRRVATIQRRKFGVDHPDTLTTMSNLSALLKAEALLAKRSEASDLADSKLREAESICRETLETEQRVFGDDHQSTLTTQNNLARILQENGEYAAAERLDRKTVSMLRRKLGDDHRYTLVGMSNLAWVLEAQEKYDEAERIRRGILAIKRSSSSAPSSLVATELWYLGALLIKKGDPSAAEPLLRECVATRRELLPAGDWRIANAQNVLGDCLTRLKRFDEAEVLLLGSHAAIRDEWGDRDKRTLRSLRRIIRMYDRWGRDEQVEPFRAQLAAATGAPPPGP